MSSRLEISSKCIDCPMQQQLRESYLIAALDPESTIHDAEEAMEAMIAADPDITPEERQKIHEESLRSVSRMLDDADENQALIQSQSDFLSESCKGPAVLSGETPMGVTISARLCGSLALRSDMSAFRGSTEPAHVVREP